MDTSNEIALWGIALTLVGGIVAILLRLLNAKADEIIRGMKSKEVSDSVNAQIRDSRGEEILATVKENNKALYENKDAK